MIVTIQIETRNDEKSAKSPKVVDQVGMITQVMKTIVNPTKKESQIDENMMKIVNRKVHLESTVSLENQIYVHQLKFNEALKYG